MIYNLTVALDAEDSRDIVVINALSVLQHSGDRMERINPAHLTLANAAGRGHFLSKREMQQLRAFATELLTQAPQDNVLAANCRTVISWTNTEEWALDKREKILKKV